MTNCLRGNRVLVKFIFTSRDSPPFVEQKGSPVIENVQTDSDPNSAFPSVGAGGSSVYVKRLEQWADHPLRSLSSCSNGLSDHDAQILTLNNITIHKPAAHHLTRRIINNSTVCELQLNLSYEFWDNVFNGDDVDIIFNNFLNTYLRIFYHTFPLKKCQYNYNIKPWITPGIKISSQHKRMLYLLCRDTEDSMLKNYYKRYCGILSDVIQTPKNVL